MNGLGVVYRLKPAYEIPQKLELPTCMYQMKNPVESMYHIKTNDHTDDEKEVLAGIMDKKPLPELALLEKRWDSVLQQLEELKSQMSAIRTTVTNACKMTGYPLLDSKTIQNLQALQGAVINANPKSPPYSLVMMQKLYKSSVPIVFSSHVHSSILNLPENLKCFVEQESLPNDKLKVHLIWKNGISDTELVLNPVKKVPIKGEVNILRLLARSGLQMLHYPCDNLVNTLFQDSVLDLCHRLLHIKTSKEKASVLKNLNAKLGRSLYFGNENINISDIAAWSALKQINVNCNQDLSPAMAKWYKRMDEIIYK